jgi:hypothetical protein
LCVCPRHQLESSADADMTALILGADCLANPTRYDVATIKFMMLWPRILRCGRQRLILTAAPTGEVLEAKWSEIDLERGGMHNPGRPDEGGQGEPRPAGTALH